MALNDVKLAGIKLCPPVYIYLVISIISFLMMVGMSAAPISLMAFVIKVLIWAFILNLICRSGYVNVSWFLVLLPFILMFIFVLFFTTGMALEAGKNMQKAVKFAM